METLTISLRLLYRFILFSNRPDVVSVSKDGNIRKIGNWGFAFTIRLLDFGYSRGGTSGWGFWTPDVGSNLKTCWTFTLRMLAQFVLKLHKDSMHRSNSPATAYSKGPLNGQSTTKFPWPFQYLGEELVILLTLGTFQDFLCPASARFCPVYVNVLVFMWCNPCGSPAE